MKPIEPSDESQHIENPSGIPSVQISTHLRTIPNTEENTALPRKAPTHGLRQGNPGNKGGGRWTKVYTLRMRALAREFVENGKAFDILQNPDHPHYLALARLVSEYAAGKPIQRTELSGEGGGPLTIRVVAEAVRRDAGS